MSGSIRPSEELSTQSWQSPICPTYFSPPFPHVLATHSFQHPIWANIHFPTKPSEEKMPWTFTWGFSLSTKAMGQGFSACKLIPPLPYTPMDKVLVYGEEKKTLFGLFSCCLSYSLTHNLSFCCTHTGTHWAVPCGECLTYAIQLAGYFCLCEWAAVSLSKLWAQWRESCESQPLTSREIPSLHPTARWLISAE